jgi:hypothetical protein
MNKTEWNDGGLEFRFDNDKLAASIRLLGEHGNAIDLENCRRIVTPVAFLLTKTPLANMHPIIKVLSVGAIIYTLYRRRKKKKEYENTYEDNSDSQRDLIKKALNKSSK